MSWRRDSCGNDLIVQQADAAIVERSHVAIRQRRPIPDGCLIKYAVPEVSRRGVLANAQGDFISDGPSSAVGRGDWGRVIEIAFDLRARDDRAAEVPLIQDEASYRVGIVAQTCLVEQHPELVAAVHVHYI